MNYENKWMKLKKWIMTTKTDCGTDYGRNQLLEKMNELETEGFRKE